MSKALEIMAMVNVNNYLLVALATTYIFCVGDVSVVSASVTYSTVNVTIIIVIFVIGCSGSAY